MRPTFPIIETPDLQSLRQRYASTILTLAFWVLWFYLWIPVLSLLAWLLGIESFYREMILFEGLYGERRLLACYGITVLLIGIAYLGWALYNQFRFRGRERRCEQRRVDDEALAEAFGIVPDEVVRLKSARRVVITHDEAGRICGIDGRGTGGSGGNGQGRRQVV